MRVGINATILDDKPSGLGVFTRQLVNHLVPMLEDYLVFSSCFEGVNVPPARRYPVKSAVSPSLGRKGHLARWTWLQYRLPLIMRKHRIDVLLSTVPEGIVLDKVKQVVVVHDLSPLVFPDIYPRLHFYFRFVVPRLLRCARYVVCDSEFTRSEVKRCYGISGEKVKVIYAGSNITSVCREEVERVRSHYGLDEYILCVASELSPRKKIPFVLSSLADFLRKPGSPKLAIIGKKDPRALPEICDLLVREKIDTRVLLLGYVPEGDLGALYAGARLLLYSSAYEGFGFPVLEGMAAGTPVVTFDVSSLPEVSGDAAVLVPPDDPVALVNSVCRVLSDDVYAASLVARGFDRVQFFSWQKSAREFYEILVRIS